MASVFTVEPGHVLAFGRAVGDIAPGRCDLANLDPRAPVLPTFVAAAGLYDPEHMRGLRPTGALATRPSHGGSILHAEQRFEYHAQVRVGDVLTVEPATGRTWEKTGGRGGVLRFRELVTDYRRPDGELCVRTTMVLVETPPPGRHP